MKDIRIPGVVWVFVLVLAVALAHTYEEQLGFDPELVDIGIVAVIAILKSLNLGTDQLNQALDVIDGYRRRSGAARMRGSADAPAGVEGDGTLLPAEVIPERPNSFARWLVG